MDVRRTRRSLGRSVVALAAALSLPGTSAFAAGPQPLPEQSCNAGTGNASERVDNVRAREAIPHIEHPWVPFPVPYCHHFNPTASPPVT
jgi:hypothetical protein